MTVVLLPLRVDEVNEVDVRWMERVLVDSEDGYDVGSVMALAAAGKCRIWRCLGSGEGILITTLDQQPSGINCIVWFLAGRGLMRDARGMFEQISHYAKAQGANSVIAHTRSKGLIRLYKQMGMREVATVLKIGV